MRRSIFLPWLLLNDLQFLPGRGQAWPYDLLWQVECFQKWQNSSSEQSFKSANKFLSVLFLLLFVLRMACLRFGLFLLIGLEMRRHQSTGHHLRAAIPAWGWCVLEWQSMCVRCHWAQRGAWVMQQYWLRNWLKFLFPLLLVDISHYLLKSVSGPKVCFLSFLLDWWIWTSIVVMVKH